MIKKYKSNEIKDLVEILRNDGVIAVPTDTVYGLCVRMYSEEARKKLETIKERLPNKSFPIMCNNTEQIESLANITNKTKKLINTFMPGPITLVLRKAKTVPEYINRGSCEIGVRMATTKELQEIIELLGEPILMTSANKSGKDVCKTIEEIEEKLPKIDAILEGTVSFGKASTIVDCMSDDYKILREGPIKLEEIEKSTYNHT